MNEQIERNRPLSSDNSLEDEMINYWGRIPEDKDLIDTARHFALWQEEQMMNEWLQDRDGCFFDGVEEGKKAMNEQMMKEAVEGRIGLVGFHNVVYIKELEWTKKIDEFKNGEKVRIIIVKEDEQ